VLLSRRSLLAAPALLAAQRRPNVIVLLTDDQRWDALGCMGNRDIRTPNIDRLSARGVTFENNFVTTSICMVSRASLFTGQHSRTHDIQNFEKPFTEDQALHCWPQLLRAAGYQAGFIGKHGIGTGLETAKHWDYFRGVRGQGNYFEPGRPHLTEHMGNQAVEFLQQQRPENPFCLQVSFKAPHVQDNDAMQFLYDPKHDDWYRNFEPKLPATADPRYVSQLPTSVHRSENRRRWGVRFSTPELYRESLRAYYRLITEVDLVVGRVEEQLRKAGQLDNTIIVFTSDNGFYLGEHGLAGKWLMHQESIRTPLIVAGPGIPQARRQAMTLNIDVAPTVLDLCAQPVPARMQGRSLRPVLAGQSVPWRNEFFYEHQFDAAGWISPTEGLRTMDWMYCRYPKEAPLFEELYSLRKDPLEKTNLAATAGAPIRTVRERTDAWRKHLDGFAPASAWREPDFAKLSLG
jgi:arylsulfatase A-like enzyme